MGANAKERDVNWGSLDNFLAMGGYGFYVWGSYGMAVLCVSLEVFFLNKAIKKTNL
jgi:heme exporter protein D